MFILSGISLWLLGRDSYHVGMSGMIYALAGFLAISGFLQKNIRSAGVSLIVIFLYGSLVWGIFPMELRVSWEAHLLGLFSGIITAVLFKHTEAPAPKMLYEIQEELGIEPGDYWKTTEINVEGQTIEEPTQNEAKIIVNYTFVPTQPVPQKDEEE